jgi:hypothetical protein
MSKRELAKQKRLAKLAAIAEYIRLHQLALPI